MLLLNVAKWRHNSCPGCRSTLQVTYWPILNKKGSSWDRSRPVWWKQALACVNGKKLCRLQLCCGAYSYWKKLCQRSQHWRGLDGSSWYSRYLYLNFAKCCQLVLYMQYLEKPYANVYDYRQPTLIEDLIKSHEKIISEIWLWKAFMSSIQWYHRRTSSEEAWIFYNCMSIEWSLVCGNL